MSELYANAKHAYSPDAEHSEELTMQIGDRIKILNQDDDGWWLGEVNGKQGMFPSNYVEIIKEEKKPDPEPQKQSKPAVKPAEKKSPKNSVTRLGVWASNLGIYCGCFYALTGLAVLIYAGFGTSPDINVLDKPYGVTDGVVGAICLVIGIIVCFAEYKHGYPRNGGKIPKRAALYILLAVPGVFTLPTRIASVLFIIPISANFYSAFLKEVWIPPQRRARPKDADDRTAMEKMKEWIAGKNPEGQFGRCFVLAVYLAFNLMVGIYAYCDAYTDRVKGPESDVFTLWVPVAKFFGHVMDLNFTILALPVSRSLIRYAYNASGNQTCGAKVLRVFLKLVPLDQALEFHQLCAWVGFVSCACHVTAHLINFGQKARLVWVVYGPAVWVTGILLVLVMLFLFSSTHANVKKGQFEIFWACHMMFPLFFALNVFHGKNWMGPNYWKWLLVPGCVFILERVYRETSSRMSVAVMSVTHMSNNVISLALEKTGPFQEYKEGQYAYLMCPAVSNFQWHPFTISSAPQEGVVTFHIRVQTPGSWTHKLQQYTKMLSKKGAAYTEFDRMDNEGKRVKGKLIGPDGKRMIRVYGPHSAPTQHLTEYNEVMIVTSGIGVTPLAAAMKSIVHFRWKYFIGKSFPDHAHFFWVCNTNEIDSFRWFVRTVKEVEDDIYDMQVKTPEAMAGKSFEFHVFITSFKGSKDDDTDLYIENDVAFWGCKKKDTENVLRESAPFDEEMLYRAMKNPAKEGTKSITMGHVTVHNGRPQWAPFFETIAAREESDKDIGVTFCGNPAIGSSLTNLCNKYTKTTSKTFHMHQEVF